MKWFLDLFFFFGDLFQTALEEGFKEDFFVQRWIPMYEASLYDSYDSEEGEEFLIPLGRSRKLAARRKNSLYEGKREPRRNRGRKVKTFRDYN